MRSLVSAWRLIVVYSRCLELNGGRADPDLALLLSARADLEDRVKTRSAAPDLEDLAGCTGPVDCGYRTAGLDEGEAADPFLDRACFSVRGRLIWISNFLDLDCLKVGGVAESTYVASEGSRIDPEAN